MKPKPSWQVLGCFLLPCTLWNLNLGPLGAVGGKMTERTVAESGTPKSLCIYPRADNPCSLNTQRLSPQKGTMQTVGREIGHKEPFKLSNSHGPDIDFGDVFLPGKGPGAAYAGLPHCVLNGSNGPGSLHSAQTKVLRRGGQNRLR